MGWEFRLLGPIEAVRDDRPVPLGAPKQRALLAVLLLSPSEVVTRERLVDELWGGAPPRSAPQSLQVYIHGLRQALGAERIETHGRGYLLRVEPEEVDVLRFDRLVEAGSRALAAGRPADAAEDLRRALALWQGEPLADLSREAVASTAAPRLAEDRLRAIELLNDSDLALGRHQELVPQLEHLIADEPYRERFRSQLVLALYRSGRQKDALDAYRAARDALVGELGVDPSPELQELERQILRQHPALAAPEPPQPGRVQLPLPPTPLLGRRLEIAAVTALLRRDETRLLTLSGPGGTGKTRLALAVAAELGPELRDGVAFVDLTPVDDPGLLAPTIAHALDLAEGAESVVEALAAHLRDRSMLLVLDNLEQLLPEVDLVGELLRAAPRLVVLATSRSPLRLAAEHVYAVPPLRLPKRDGNATFEDLTASDAVRLFVERARAVDAAFELDDENVHAVVHVCERLDGLPLAIELAAARSKLLPPAALGRRLDRSLDFLTGGPRDAPARHQTLRSTLEWSYELLSDQERTLFRRLTVFAGGWSLDAAESVCGNGGLDVVEVLSSLVDESLVRRLTRAAPEPRFGMLETIREFATDLLRESGELDRLRRRHAEHLLALAEKANEAILSGPNSEPFYAQLDDEHDNLRAALTWAAETGEVELEVRLVVAARWFWTVRGYLSEGRRFFEGALERAAAAPKPLRATALAHGAIFPYRQGATSVAKQQWEEALALFRELEDPDGIGRVTGDLGGVAVAEGDLDRAVELYEEALQLFREQDNRVRVGIALSNLGAIENMRHEPEAAVRYYDEAVELQRQIGANDNLAISLHNVSRSLITLGRLEEARAALEESIALARRLGYREVIAYCLGGLAELAMVEEDPERAARALGAAQTLFAEVGVAIDREEVETQEKIRSYAVERLGQDRADELVAAGAGTSVEELIVL